MKNNGIIIQDGLFRVCDDGTVYRIYKGIEKLASTSLLKFNGQYKLITRHPTNWCRTYYVANLIAEAFIDNWINLPKMLKVVKYRDNNPANCSADNLYIELHSNQELLCIECHTRVPTKYGSMCAECYNSVEALAYKIDTALNYTKNVIESQLSNEDLTIIRMRRQGYSFRDISKILQLSTSHICCKYHNIVRK